MNRQYVYVDKSREIVPRHHSITITHPRAKKWEVQEPQYPSAAHRKLVEKCGHSMAIEFHHGRLITGFYGECKKCGGDHSKEVADFMEFYITTGDGAEIMREEDRQRVMWAERGLSEVAETALAAKEAGLSEDDIRQVLEAAIEMKRNPPKAVARKPGRPRKHELVPAGVVDELNSEEEGDLA